MNAGSIRRRVLAAIAATCSLLASAAEPAQPDVFSELVALCPTPVSMCWKPVADRLDRMGNGHSQRDDEGRLLNYAIVAQVAYKTGDVAEAKRLYGTVLRLAQKVRVEGQSIAPAFRLVAAEPYLTSRDYARALDLLDDATDLPAGDAAHQAYFGYKALLRAAALIGLQRGAEADFVLQDVLDKLDYDAEGFWEWFPGLAQPMGPFEVARRIAVHLGHEGKYEQALAILGSLELRAAKAVGQERGTPLAGTWASRTDRAAILESEAAVYLEQGKFGLAGQRLRQAIGLREKQKPGWELKKALMRLAKVEKRAGRTDEQRALEQRAAALGVQADASGTDPLAETLPLD